MKCKLLSILILTLFIAFTINAHENTTDNTQKLIKYNNYIHNTYIILTGILIMGIVTTLIMITNHYGTKHLKNTIIFSVFMAILIFLLIINL